jgi:hypothetical protein
MPIRPFLSGEEIDQETLRVLGVAFEQVCIALRTGVKPASANCLSACCASQGLGVASRKEGIGSSATGQFGGAEAGSLAANTRCQSVAAEQQKAHYS